jgi:hypothetical protein
MSPADGVIPKREAEGVGVAPMMPGPPNGVCCDQRLGVTPVPSCWLNRDGVPCVPVAPIAGVRSHRLRRGVSPGNLRGVSHLLEVRLVPEGVVYGC